MKNIAGLYRSHEAARESVLERARLCASLTKPWVLPPLGLDDLHDMPQPFQSVGSRGVTAVAGRMLLSLFPPGVPFFQMKLAAKFLFSQAIDESVKHQLSRLLHFRELQIYAMLERDRTGGSRSLGFRSAKQKSLTQLIVTGDTLEQLTDDYALKVFRRDQYVTCRMPDGRVRYHIVVEKVDPMGLSESHLAKIKDTLNHDDHEDPQKRMVDLYTMIEWDAKDEVWIERQEINERLVFETTHKVTPFFATAYELAPGHHYGRGLVEMNLGDLQSFDALRETMLDYAVLASKHHPVTDITSQVKPDDLAQPSGTPITNARVSGGQVQDIGFLRVDKMADYSIVASVAANVRSDLGAAFLLESESQPTGERVTAYQVQRIALELETMMGGIYSTIADSQQLPLLHRLTHQMEVDKLIEPLGDMDDSVEYDIRTGVAALTREIDRGKMQDILQTIAALGPEAIQRVNIGVLLDVMMNQTAFYAPNLIKSDEDVERERAAMMQEQAAMAAANEAVGVAGDAARTAMTAGG